MMRNLTSLEDKSSIRDIITNDLSNAGLRIDPTKHRSAHLNKQSQQQQQQKCRVFNVPFQQMEMILIKVENFDLTVPIFLRWCFDWIRRSIKHEGLFRKSGGSQRVKELMTRIEDGLLTTNLSPSNTVFDICSVFKEFLRRLPSPLITYPVQDLLLDCFAMRSIPAEKKVDLYLNILLLLPDEHLHALIYILRFLHEITFHERDNKMSAKNLAICVGPGIMRTAMEGKGNLMSEQCATSVSEIVETLIVHAMKLGFISESVYERAQMLLEMRQKEGTNPSEESFALENALDAMGKGHDAANAKKRRSGSVKEFLVHMTNRLRRRSGSNNDSRDQTNVFLDQSAKFSSSSSSRDYRSHYHQQNSVSGHCLSSSSTSATTTKRKSSDDPNGGNSKRGKTKSSLPDSNRFTSPMSAFRRKKKASGMSNDPGFPFKIEHAHLPQLLHFTDEVPARFTNPMVNHSNAPVVTVSSNTAESMATLTTSIANNGSIVLGAFQPSAMIPTDHPPPIISSSASVAATMNKSLDAKKLNLLDSWKWPKSSRKAERKPLVAIHAPMLVPSSNSLAQSPPSPIRAAHPSGSSSLMHSSFAVPRRHSDDVVSQSLSANAYRPRRSISSSGGQQQTRQVVCVLNNHSHSLPSNHQNTSSDEEEEEEEEDEEEEEETGPNPLNLSQESFDDEEEMANELNLAVVDGNEDLQSLRAFPAEATQPEQGALDVAFIDENDLEGQQQKPMLNEEPCNAMDVQHMSNNDTMMEVDGKATDLEDVLRRNENRCVRLTDSDDDDHVNFSVSLHRQTPPNKTTPPSQSRTPQMPVRLSSSISNLISTSSLLFPTGKERSLSCSLSQPTSTTAADLFPSSKINDENLLYR